MPPLAVIEPSINLMSRAISRIDIQRCTRVLSRVPSFICASPAHPSPLRDGSEPPPGTARAPSAHAAAESLIANGCELALGPGRGSLKWYEVRLENQ